MAKGTKNRPVYRKWFNPDEDSLNYLKIDRDGKMLQITFENYETPDPYCSKVSIGETTPLNRLDHDVFRNQKEVCAKSEFDKAQRKAITMIKGRKMDRSDFKNSKALR